MKQPLIIIVPLYQSSLSEDERISLKRLEQVCDAPKCIVAPKGFVKPEQLQEWKVEEFEPMFFEGIQGYNRLMMSEAFYERFIPYEYILIHQSDAFLFRNELDVWCKKGYPYVGAPWLIKRKYQGIGRILLHLRAIPRRLQKKPFLPLDFGNKVGNGGLSLRRVDDFLEVCHTQAQEMQRWLTLSQIVREYNEDCFWASQPNWSYPSAAEALQFSIDLDPKDAMEQNHGKLPMGCHGWTKPQYRPFWWPYISKAIQA